MEKRTCVETPNLGGKPALIVVNMTQGFTDPESPLGPIDDSVLIANQKLLNVFRLSGIPICFTSLLFSDEKESSVLRCFQPELNILQANTKWVEVSDTLGRLGEEPLFEQVGPSSFYDTNLSAWLVLNEIDSLVITGADTSDCIRATVVGGIQHNYPICVAKDACSDKDQAAHEANLADIANKYASVKTVDEILQSMLPDAELTDSDYI